MKDLPPPGLDLFDLDEQFASERIKMAQLTNKCNDDDIEYFVKECGDIMGLSQFVNHPDDPKAILHYIFQEIVKYKTTNLSWTDSHADHFGGANKAGRRSNCSNAANAEAGSEQAYSDIP